MNGGHQTLQNPEVVIDDFADGSQTIGGAASITDLKKTGDFNNLPIKKITSFSVVLYSKSKYQLLSDGLLSF